jgi:hypothetical protein
VTNIETITKRQFVARIGHLVEPLAKKPFGPVLKMCPACLVDDRSDKRISDITIFMNHVIRHMRRVPGPYPLPLYLCDLSEELDDLEDEAML